ncbi:hypothetical protein JL720_4026 [Aureococcus anophagefferens]|nr:hypothetical protein JL720_4026 [Aureococcus anophagefferens]
MSTFGDLFFNSVVLGGRGRRDAPDDASSSDGCGGDDDVELSLADDDASDGCGAGGEEPAAPDPRATFRDELLARPARPPAGGGAGFWAHFADVYDLATCRGAMLEADLRLEQEAHLATRQLLARSTAELGRLRDSQALALVEAAQASAKISAAGARRGAEPRERRRGGRALLRVRGLEKLCADAYALGGSSDRDDGDRKAFEYRRVFLS